MLLRPILSRIHKHQRFANFCILNNGGAKLENVISASSSKEKSLEKGHAVSYLVNSSGLSQEKAISASKRVHFDGPDKPNAVGSKPQIAELVRKLPQILVYNPEKFLFPKFEFLLHSTGISEKDFLATVSRHHDILSRSFENRVAPIYNYVKDKIGAGKVDILLRKGSWIFQVGLENTLRSNVDFLREIGVPKQCMDLALFHFTRIFSSNHVEFRKIVEEVKHMGFNRSKSTFILAIHARTGNRNMALWDQCYEVYSEWGWSKDDIHMAFRKHPICMLLSEKKISRALNFLVNKVGREPRSMARCPHILSYNIEKRIVPRCSVVHLLSSSKGLVKKDLSLGSVLGPVEEKFLDKYVTRYKERLPQLHDIYRSKKVKGVEA